MEPRPSNENPPGPQLSQSRAERPSRPVLSVSIDESVELLYPSSASEVCSDLRVIGSTAHAGPGPSGRATTTLAGEHARAHALDSHVHGDGAGFAVPGASFFAPERERYNLAALPLTMRVLLVSFGAALAVSLFAMALVVVSQGRPLLEGVSDPRKTSGEIGGGDESDPAGPFPILPGSGSSNRAGGRADGASGTTTTPTSSMHAVAEASESTGVPATLETEAPATTDTQTGSSSGGSGRPPGDVSRRILNSNATEIARPYVVIAVLRRHGQHERIDCLLNTWVLQASRIPESLGSIEVIFFTQENDFYPKDLNTPLQVNIPYPSYPPRKKLKATFSWLVANRSEADFYMRADSDTYIFTTQLMLYLRDAAETKDMEHFFTGCCGGWVSGNHFGVSRQTAVAAVNDSDVWWNCRIEESGADEVMFAECLNELTHTRPISSPQFFVQWPNRPEYRQEAYAKYQAEWVQQGGDTWPISFHHMNRECFDHQYTTSERLMAQGIHNVAGYKEVRERLNITVVDLLDEYGCPGNTNAWTKTNVTFDCPMRRSDYVPWANYSAEEKKATSDTHA